jgi:hypothetical protein
MLITKENITPNIVLTNTQSFDNKKTVEIISLLVEDYVCKWINKSIERYKIVNSTDYVAIEIDNIQRELDCVIKYQDQYWIVEIKHSVNGSSKYHCLLNKKQALIQSNNHNFIGVYVTTNHKRFSKNTLKSFLNTPISYTHKYPRILLNSFDVFNWAFDNGYCTVSEYRYYVDFLNNYN